MHETAMRSMTLRLSALLVLAMMSAGCEVVEGIFKAGLFVGVIAVLLVVGLIVWLARMFRG